MPFISRLANLFKLLIHLPMLYFYKMYFTFAIKKSLHLNKPFDLFILPGFFSSQEQLTHTLDSIIIKSLLHPNGIQYENINIQYNFQPDGSWRICITPITGILFDTSKYAELISSLKKLLVDHQLYSLSRYNQLLWVYTYITTHCSYTDDAKANNPWSAFFQGQTQCYGYALLTKLLLDMLAIPNLLVGGKIPSPQMPSSDLHAWNLVRLGFKWYHFDTCFGSTSIPSPTNNYFLCGSCSLTPHHNWSTTWHLLPIAHSSYTPSSTKRKEE